MTGDQNDMVGRLKLALPLRWFSDTAPVLTSLLAGFAASWSNLYGLLAAVRVQSRVGSATDSFLDMAAQDFFGKRLWRRPNEADISFRSRLQWAMQRTLVTRLALTTIAQQAGYDLGIFEPTQPCDTGVYNLPTKLAWNVSGGWGSFDMPFECLMTASNSGSGSYPDELLAGLAEAMPSGGAAWVRIAS